MAAWLGRAGALCSFRYSDSSQACVSAMLPQADKETTNLGETGREFCTPTLCLYCGKAPSGVRFVFCSTLHLMRFLYAQAV